MKVFPRIERLCRKLHNIRIQIRIESIRKCKLNNPNIKVIKVVIPPSLFMDKYPLRV